MRPFRNKAFKERQHPSAPRSLNKANSLGNRLETVRVSHWKAKIKVMGEVRVWSHNVNLTFYRLTSLSFHVNGPSHSRDSAFSNFDLENPRSRSWVRWTLKVTTWVQHPIDSRPFSFHVNRPSHCCDTAFSKSDLENPFHSMSIGHAIPEIRLFKNLTLKIQGQGHGWGEHWKSQHGSNILSTHIPFIPCQTAMPFLTCDFFKI